MNKYRGIVEINPKEKWIKVNIQIEYLVKDECSDTLEFYLYHLLEIDELICDNMSEFSYEQEIIPCNPFITETRILKIKFKKPIRYGEYVKLKIHYSGVVEKVSQWETNRITEELIELGLYAPWYPLTKIEDATFDIKISLPNEYQVINGDFIDGYYHLKQDKPTNDCTILASQNFKVLTEDNNRIIFYYMLDKQKDMVEQGFLDSKLIFDFFIKTFGMLDHSNKLSIVLVSREIGGGYSREGLIVLQGGLNMRYLAHEISHLWWNKADSVTDDWLNESFAEYSALMLIRELDEKDFLHYINKYINNSKDTLPIPNVNREDELSYIVLYQKGPIFLYRLEQKIGKESFIKLLKEVHSQRIHNTSDFFQLLEQVTNINIVIWFKNIFENE